MKTLNIKLELSEQGCKALIEALTKNAAVLRADAINPATAEARKPTCAYEADLVELLANKIEQETLR